MQTRGFKFKACRNAKYFRENINLVPMDKCWRLFVLAFVCEICIPANSIFHQ